jgi:hypothetical protein
MAKLLLYLARPVYFPGDPIEGEAVLQTDKPLTVRNITVAASGFERTVITESRGSGKHRHTVTYTEQNPILNEGAVVGPPGEVPPGEQRFPFRFQLPPNALPTYRGRQANVFYSVRANADIPMWFDAGQTVEVPVVLARRCCREDQTPLRFSSEDPDDPSRPGFMAQVLRTTHFAGGFVEGAVTLTADGGKRVRKATVTLNTLETATARGHVEENLREIARQDLSGDQLGPERAAPFRIYAPKDAPGTYNGMYSSLNWFLSVKLDVAWAFDVNAAQAITVYNAV